MKQTDLQNKAGVYCVNFTESGQINRDETTLEDLYKRYGDRRIYELLAIVGR